MIKMCTQCEKYWDKLEVIINGKHIKDQINLEIQKMVNFCIEASKIIEKKWLKEKGGKNI